MVKFLQMEILILYLASENCKFTFLQQNCQGKQILNVIKLLLMPNETELTSQGRVEMYGYEYTITAPRPPSRVGH